MADKSKTIIVRKVKKGHEGGHGGSWKVAYADFVTAMMAFFLLMWLLAMVSPEKRAAMSEYFKDYSVFKESGRSFMKGSDEMFSKSGGQEKVVPQGITKSQGQMATEAFTAKLKKAIDEKLQGLKEHLMVDTVEGGVRIQLVDTQDKPMFRPGSADLSQSAKEILSFVADNIRDMPNKIAVEGHTDAAPLKAGQFTNWELSTDRASSARRELQVDNIDVNRIARVVGFADTELLLKNNPTDSRNRRISIILLNEKVEPPKAVGPAETKASVFTTIPTTSTTTTTTPAPKPATGQEQKKTLVEPIGVAPGKPIEMKGPVINNPMQQGARKPQELVKPAQQKAATTTIPASSTTVKPAAKPSPRPVTQQQQKKSLMEPLAPPRPIDINKSFVTPGQ